MRLSQGKLVYNITHMPLFASIDVGSNTLRILIGEFVDGRIKVIHTDRKTTRLGSMADQTGMLQPESMAASLQVLRKFASVINRLHIKHVMALGTSALREAQNSVVFLQRVQKTVGVRIIIISGEKEAQLTLKGILHAFSATEKEAVHGMSHTPPLFIMDIGGGSSEWIVYQGRERCIMGSLPRGVIKLTQQCITTDPPSRRDMTALHRVISSALDHLVTDTGPMNPESMIFVGTGGTFTTIASVDLGLVSYSREKIHLHRIPLSRLEKMQKRFLHLRLNDRKKIQGLEPGRADLIIPGVQFTMMVMELFGFKELVVSDYGLLEGALLEMKEEIEKGIREAGKS